MTIAQLARMEDLFQQLETITSELDALKEAARVEAAGNPGAWVTPHGVITITAQGKPSTTLDTAALRRKEPDTWQALITAYGKQGAPRKGAIKYTPSVKA